MHFRGLWQSQCQAATHFTKTKCDVLLSVLPAHKCVCVCVDLCQSQSVRWGSTLLAVWLALLGKSHKSFLTFKTLQEGRNII